MLSVLAYNFCSEKDYRQWAFEPRSPLCLRHCVELKWSQRDTFASGVSSILINGRCFRDSGGEPAPETDQFCFSGSQCCLQIRQVPDKAKDDRPIPSLLTAPTPVPLATATVARYGAQPLYLSK